MKTNIATLISALSLLFSSCNMSNKNYEGYWVNEKYENNLSKITKIEDGYLISELLFQGEQRNIDFHFSMNNEGNLTYEVKNKVRLILELNNQDELIFHANNQKTKYVRINKSKNYKIAKFEGCSLVDMFHLNFTGMKEDFGANHRNNKYGEYKLCVDDENGNIISNTEYVGKEFIISWDMKKIEVSDPIEPWKTSMVESPRITYLKLKE